MAPSSFSWRAVRRSDRAGVPPGNYAADAIDQHTPHWCGCCYLVAAAQCVEDRARIALARCGGRTAPTRLVLQTLLDHFVEWSAGPGWSACHGGFPLHVLQCLADGTCPMLVEEETQCAAWWGFPRVLRRCPAPTARYRVTNARRVAPHTVRDALVREGPVVLEVNATTLKSVDARGVVTDLTPRLPNHAVCVVGWRRVGRCDCWVVRNSWGATHVPRDLPTDLETCVGPNRNECVVEWEPWRGDPHDPGFLLLPQSFPPLQSTTPSPWIAATVTVP